MWPYVELMHHLPGHSACRFEFYSQITTAKEERYLASRRYRLNHWLPLVDTYPMATATGLRFEHYHDEPLTGMVSPWTLSTGLGKMSEASIYVSKYDILQQGIDADSYLEMGVGFLKYTAPYWLPMNAMKFAIHRKVSTFDNYYFTTLHQERTGPTFVCNRGSSVRFKLLINGNTLWLDAIEYADDGVTSTSTASHSIVVDSDEQFHVIFFVRGTKDCSAHVTLVKTVFAHAENMHEREIILFPHNPAVFRLPEANIRSSKLPLIQQPHKAFIEDGSLEISSPMTSPLWFNTLKYLVDYTVEPCIFTDVESNPWLVCLGDLKGDGPSNRRGQIRSGYSLNMPILVMH